MEILPKKTSRKSKNNFLIFDFRDFFLVRISIYNFIFSDFGFRNFEFLNFFTFFLMIDRKIFFEKKLKKFETYFL